MRLRLCVSGRLRKGPELAIFNRYLSRVEKIGRLLNVYPVEISEFDGVYWTKFLTKLNSPRVLSRRSYKVLLDERGKKLSSKCFAETLRAHQNNGIQELIFFIGGPDGMPARFSDNFDETISFGKMVWPHFLARIMLIEQIYRAHTILAGLPYHKE